MKSIKDYLQTTKDYFDTTIGMTRRDLLLIGWLSFVGGGVVIGAYATTEIVDHMSKKGHVLRDEPMPKMDIYKSVFGDMIPTNPDYGKLECLKQAWSHKEGYYFDYYSCDD